MADAKPKDLFLLEGISHFCFNKDFTQCALSKKDNNIYIYQVTNINEPDKWVQLHVLKGHILYISGMDWCPATNRIVTCSYDKTALIWDYSSGKWTASNLNATSKLCYLFVNWNSRGDKFVAGTSEKKLFMGYFSKQADWWAARNIKAHKSSVVCARIDPTSLFILSGSTDMKIIVSSCYEPSIDDEFLGGMDKSTIPAFETKIFEFDCGSWVNTVNWNQSGTLCYAGAQNSNIYLIDPLQNKCDVLPLTHSAPTMIIPKGDDSIYVVGFDREIYLYQKEGDKWAMKKRITDDGSKGKTGATGISGVSGGGVAERLKAFGSAGVKKKQSLVFTTDQNENIHPTTINSLIFKDNKIITSDYAGFVKFWTS